MKPKALVCALVAISLAPVTPAFAQADDQENLDRNFQQIQRVQEWQARHGSREVPPGMRVYPAPEQPGYDRRGDGRYDGDRGAGPNHEFYPGMHLPRQYRGYNYIVNDWRGHRLAPPPPGYQWVQTGADYVLVAIATGLIVQLLLMNN